MKNNVSFFLFVLIFIPFITFPSMALCQPPISLEAGIQQYGEDNYEEAIEILTQVRGNDPKSSMAAYFLGLAYKKVMDYPNAAVHLEAAVTLTPKVREALVELIDDLYQMNKIDESKRWIQVAERENIFPAKIAFLKGLVLSKEKRNREAIEAFETAKKLDPSLAQASDFHIALCYMKDKKSVQAKEILGAVIERDPLSDLAAYARRYQDVVEKDIYMERPLRLTIGIYGSYDTNILAKPSDEAAATGITGEKAYVLTSSVRLDYVPRFEGPWLFNAGYAFASSLHSENTHSIDSMANTVYISPGYSFGRVAINLYAAYTDALLRTDPDLYPDPDSSPGYKRYFNYMTYGPIVRVLVTQNNILELFAGYDKKDYYNQKKTFPSRTDSFYDDNRDATGPRTYVSWIWLFRENAFLNLRYEFNQDHADGSWWENEGHMFSINASIPLLADATAKRTGQVKLQLSGSAFFQNYKYDQTFVDEDGTTKTEPRKDETYTGSIGLSWDFWKYATFLVQYQKIRAYSNMPIYDYDRNIYMTGFEFRF